MPQEYDNTNTGVLFRNDKKETDKQPDHTGTINVEGKEYRLAAWVREAKSGKKFFSLKISEPQARDEAPKPAPAQADFDDDIPF